MARARMGRKICADQWRQRLINANENIHKLRSKCGEARLNAQVFAELLARGKELKHLNKTFDGMDEKMNELNRQIEMAEEISSALSTPLDGEIDGNEDKIQEELDRMEEENETVVEPVVSKQRAADEFDKLLFA